MIAVLLGMRALGPLLRMPGARPVALGIVAVAIPVGFGVQWWRRRREEQEIRAARERRRGRPGG